MVICSLAYEIIVRVAPWMIGKKRLKFFDAWRKWLQSSYDMFLENLNKRCYTKIIIIFWRFYYAQNER